MADHGWRGAGPPRRRAGYSSRAPRSARRFTRRSVRRRFPDYATAARRRLRGFRRSSALAIATTGLLLALWVSAGQSQEQDHPNAPAPELLPAESAASAESAPAAAEADAAKDADADPVTSVREATGTVRDLLGRAWGLLPKLLIAILIMVVAALLARLVRRVVRRSLRSWSRSSAVSALAGVAIYLLALGAALSVIAGDARALVGSVGLTGLALSWALQTPIESFTGWLLNSFKGYYRIGDRIAVGDVFGDVYAIDFLTTTVWEAGGPGKPVQGAQPTGALITFPNLEVLRNNIVNYTREFPHVWDEVTFGLANESDLGYAADVIRRVAAGTLGGAMRAAAGEYRRILSGRGLDFDVSDEPQVYLALAEAWTNATVRYIVPARERRHWASALIQAVTAELAKPEHARRVRASYPRTQVELLHPGAAAPPDRESGGLQAGRQGG